MEITRENLIKEEFIESTYKGLPFFRKGGFGLVCNYGLWLPCNCETGIPLNNRTYVSTMEEVLEAMKH